MPLIPNNGWETGDNGGWTVASPGNPGMDIVTTNVRNGTYALEINRASGSGGAQAFYENKNFAQFAGFTVEFTVYALLISGTTHGTIQIIDGDNPTSSHLLVSNSSTWTKNTVTHTVGASPIRLRFAIQVSSGQGISSIDDMVAKGQGQRTVGGRSLSLLFRLLQDGRKERLQTA